MLDLSERHNSCLLTKASKVPKEYFTARYPPHPSYFISDFGLINRDIVDCMGFTYGCDHNFNQALVLFELLDNRRTLPLALLGFDDNCDNYEVFQIRGARDMNRGQLDKVLWGEALFSSLIDKAIESQVETISVIPSHLVGGSPKNPEIIKERYNNLPKRLGFRFDSKLNRHILKVQGVIDDLEEEIPFEPDSDKILSIDGFKLF